MSNLIPVEVNYNIGSIVNNLDDVAKSVREYCDAYKGIVVTDVADSKQMLAQIRKAKKALDDQRKEIKKAWNEPYTKFEKKVKAVIELYDEPINLINDQLNELEEQRRIKKREQIKALWEEYDKPDVVGTWVSLDGVYNVKWENATYKLKDIEQDFHDIFATLIMSYSTIKAMNHPYESEGIERLKITKDLQSAISYMTQLQKQEELIKVKQEQPKEEPVKQEPERAQYTRLDLEIKSEDLLRLVEILDESGIYYIIH